MKRILVIIVALIFAGQVMGQKAVPDSLAGWKTGAVATLSGTQVALVNWSAGGEESLSGVALFNAFANYKKNKSPETGNFRRHKRIFKTWIYSSL